MNTSSRKEHVARFYDLLEQLRIHNRRMWRLGDLQGRMNWPTRGIYFFFEENEMRSNGHSMRVVRVGTHAVSEGSKSTLWNRLRAHRGSSDGLGNHRGSIFRLHVGASIIARERLQDRYPSWGIGQNANQEIRKSEADMERAVSEVIGKMYVLWIGVYDTASSRSDRAYLEQNSIALLAGPEGPIDTASKTWLGHHSAHPAIRKSALWNVNYVSGSYSPEFLDVLDRYVQMMTGMCTVVQHSLAPSDWSCGTYPQLTLIEDTDAK